MPITNERIAVDEMPILIHCRINSTLFTPSLPFTNPTPIPDTRCRTLRCRTLPKFRHAHVRIRTKARVFDEFKDTLLSKRPETEELKDTLLPKRPENQETEELELLNKPYPKQASNEPVEEKIEQDVVRKPDKDEILESFNKFFRPLEDEESQGSVEEENGSGEKVSVEYYEPKAGDLVVGVVVSGNENKLDVNVGADLLGTMLTKEVLPLYDREMEYVVCDVDKDAEEFFVRGKVGILKSEVAMSGGRMAGRPVVEVGSVLFAEVLGRTLGGRPLLSARRLFRRIAWDRVRQIKQLNEPIEVKITEWNTGGLLTRVEGLRAFLPKVELMNRVNNYTELKENVGRRIHVLITRINEDTNDLILSEREAWEMMHLQPGTLLEGKVRKVFPYGAQIRIGDSNRSGLLHISNITRGQITSVSDLLTVDEKVKVVVVKSMFPDKISLSIAELESEPGLFLSNKEKVFSEAEEMAKKYRQKLSTVNRTRKLEELPTDGLPFEDEEKLYANWKWFKFERNSDTNPPQQQSG